MGGNNNSKPHRKNSVRFAPPSLLCEYCKVNPMATKQTLEEKWYQPNDYADFREVATEISDAAIEKGFDDFLYRIFCKQEEHGDDESGEHYDCDKELLEQNALNLWSQSKESRRGLERFVCKRYGMQMKMNRSKVVQAILYTQRQISTHKSIQFSTLTSIKSITLISC